VENGVVKVIFKGTFAGCPMRKYTLVNFVESTLKKKLPAVKHVETVDDIRDKFGVRGFC
jgi:Fe-S cluster biogenesis protein NfuA